jgi:hypothetical protein
MNRRTVPFAAIAALSFMVAPGTSEAQDASPLDRRFDKITDCIEARKAEPGGAKVAVLFLIDTSESLRTTDPLGERVVGLKAALAALQETVRAAEEIAADSGTPPKVSVFTEFLEFGTTTRRTFPGEPEWLQMTSSSGDLLARVADGYRQNNKSEDTDYVSALEPWKDRNAKPDEEVGAIQMLERAPVDSCRLVVWFTDGELSLDYKKTSKTLHWIDPPILLDSAAAEKPAYVRAVDALCKPDGIVDALRGADRSMLNGAPFVTGVAFGKVETFGLFAAITAGRSGVGDLCGDQTKEVNGAFLQASDVATMTRAILAAVVGDPNPPVGPVGTCYSPNRPIAGVAKPDEGTRTFDFPASLRGFSLLAVAGEPNIITTIIAPNGTYGVEGTFVSLTEGGEFTLSNGTVIHVTSLDDNAKKVWFIGAKFPSDRSDWAGTWTVQFCSEDQGVADRVDDNNTDLYLFGELQAELQQRSNLRLGIPGTFSVVLTSAAGQPKTDAAWTTESILEIALNGQRLTTPTVNPAGSFQFAYTPPADSSPGTLPVTARLVPKVKVAPDLPVVELPEWSGAIGEITVLDVPKLPIVGEATPFESALDADHLTIETTFPIVAPDVDGAGCVTLLATPTIERPNGMKIDPKVSLYLDGKEIAPGTDCPIALANGDTKEIQIVVSTTTDQLKVTTDRLSMSVPLRSTSNIDPSQTEDVDLLFAATVKPKIVTTTQGTKLLGLLVLTLLPVILLYGYNLLFAARFEVAEFTQYAVAPVAIRNGRLVSNRAPAHSSEVVALDDFKIGPDLTSRKRTATFGDFEFAARAPLTPFGEAYGLVDGGDGYIAVAQRGMTRRTRRGLLGLSLGRTWAFRIPSAELTLEAIGTDPFGDEALNDVTGELLVIVERLPDGERLGELIQRIVGESVPKISRTVVSFAKANVSAAESGIPTVGDPPSPERAPRGGKKARPTSEPSADDQRPVDDLPGGAAVSASRMNPLPGGPSTSTLFFESEEFEKSPRSGRRKKRSKGDGEPSDQTPGASFGTDQTLPS